MNTLADNALFEAFLCGRRQMTRLDVERANRDLGWASYPTGPTSAANSSPEESRALQDTLSQLDSELANAFQTTEATPNQGPPKKEEPEPADLLVELVED